jgi:ATP-dependent DNA helicase RecG
MAVSTLTEKPNSAPDVITRVLSLNRVHEVEKRLTNVLQKKQQVYWVCPLVKNSEKMDLTSAEERFHSLSQKFPRQVVLLHGQMKSDEKKRIITEFFDGKYAILVTTTVIETGIDSANATAMIVEHAERFGLSQLHQLRGRVGRRTAHSWCLFLYEDSLTESAKQRLLWLRHCTNGFEIAEKDLQLRGEGNIWGTQQSGSVSMRCLTTSFHKTEEIKAQEQEIYSRLLLQATQLSQELCQHEFLSPAIQLLLKMFQSQEEELPLKRAG